MKHITVCALLVFACGGDDGSGVEPALPLGTLADVDIDAICTYAASLSRTVDCDSFETESTTSVADCVDLVNGLSETCEATVGDFETCFEDLAAQSDEDVCALEVPTSCDFLGDPDCLDI